MEARHPRSREHSIKTNVPVERRLSIRAQPLPVRSSILGGRKSARTLQPTLVEVNIQEAARPVHLSKGQNVICEAERQARNGGLCGFLLCRFRQHKSCGKHRMCLTGCRACARLVFGRSRILFSGGREQFLAWHSFFSPARSPSSSRRAGWRESSSGFC
jgi:hypothetical protein